MVILHEKHMRSCVEVWKIAKTKNIILPITKDTDYESLEHLISHVCRAARGYMTWICEKLELPDPEIKAAPVVDLIEKDIDSYIDHLLERWAIPLVELDEERFNEVHTARWGVDYCIDAMLEHAVMHPIRHQFQLEELINAQS